MNLSQYNPDRTFDIVAGIAFEISRKDMATMYEIFLPANADRLVFWLNYDKVADLTLLGICDHVKNNYWLFRTKGFYSPETQSEG